jgi:hypothetical protein
LQKLNRDYRTKQISSQNYTITPKHKINLQKLNANTKLKKLKGRRNSKIIAETDEIPNLTEAEDKISLQKILQKHCPCKPPANSL